MPEPAQLQNDQLWVAETEDLAVVGLYSPKEIENCREKCYFLATRRPHLEPWLMETAWPLVSAHPRELETFLCTVWPN
ncbi:MAG: hypothetical protein GY696_05375 [Gammaproteobacteria bacterium]|nr:hypothetical protein [Gammaproteobacteria bacterium]